MSGRHADAVDAAEAVVWTEAIRTRALLLVAQADEANDNESTMRFVSATCACRACRWMRTATELLRQIAGTR